MEADIHKAGCLTSLFCVLDEGFRILTEFCGSLPSLEVMKFFIFDCFLIFFKLGLFFALDSNVLRSSGMEELFTSVDTKWKKLFCSEVSVSLSASLTS